MEFLFGLDQSNVCRDIEKIESLIRECLPIPQKLYNVTKRLKNREEVEQYFPGFMAFTDCTEQPIPRPKNRLRRRLDYTIQERERNTLLRTCTVNQKELIIYKTKHKQVGRKHDYKVYKDNHPNIPKDVTSMYDLGFFGVETDYSKQKSSLPIKRKKNQILTKKEEEVQQKPFFKKNSGGTCNLQVEKVQDNERCL